MASSIQLPTTDLRHSAKEAKRDQDHKAKWARGGRLAPGKWCTHGVGDDCGCDKVNARPVAPYSAAVRKVDRSTRQHSINQLARGMKSALRHDVTDEVVSGPSDSSAEEEVWEASAAPEPDTEITYSYDATRGPGKGSQILSMAITQAVERYENKETEKLAKEYEFVGKENDNFGDGYVADDDFELIEREG